jgi:hypothetical protein
MAKAKGTPTPISPAIWLGGWKNMPGWVRRGLMPCPSKGVNGSSLNGLAMVAMTAM